MSFDPNILISSSFGDYTRTYLSGSELVPYYINDHLSENIEIAFGTADTLNHDDQYEIFIRSLFQDLDPLISLDFEEVYDEDQAILKIYSVSDFSRWDDSTFGQVSMQSNHWDILWRSSSFDVNFDLNTIIHEIGHSLGLSHPNEDPTNFLWDTDDTVMSYNKSSNGWNTSFSSNDIQALQLIWGSEDDGLINNSSADSEVSENELVAPSDDYSQDSNTNGEVGIGESISGRIGSPGDRDWFAFNLTAGEILQLQLNGDSANFKRCPCFSCNQKLKNNNSRSYSSINQENQNHYIYNPLIDPYLRLFNSEEELLMSDDDSGIGLNSFLQYKADYSGTYYASAGTFLDDSTGNYILNLSLDDFANDQTTKGILNYGEEIAGKLELEGDKDWFAIQTNIGDQFQISLEGNTLKDAYLNLYNSNGEIVSYNDDFSGENLNSKIDFVSNYSGNYFISVESFKSRYKGSYSLSALLISSPNIENSINSDLETLNYIACNPDLIIAFGTNLDLAREHYISHGRSEGRITNGFNPTNYLNNYDDLSNAFGTDLESAIRHFINNGYSEGRTDKNIFKIHNNSEFKDNYISIESFGDVIFDISKDSLLPNFKINKNSYRKNDNNDVYSPSEKIFLKKIESLTIDIIPSDINF